MKNIKVVVAKYTCTSYDVVQKGKSIGYTDTEIRGWMSNHAIYGEDGDGYFTLDDIYGYGYNKELIHIFEELLKESYGNTIIILD